VKRISDGQEYALKKVKLGQLKEKEKENAVNEVRILASLSDPFIIGYKVDRPLPPPENRKLSSSRSICAS
jgi:hypothetical protein